jgi:thiamine-phosphate pyrophosphorylase
MFRESLLEGLYVLTDNLLTPPDTIEQQVKQAIEGGSKVIQFRDKTRDSESRLEQAQRLQKLCSQHNALLIINDDIQLAAEVNADGVHLGKEDENLQRAREKLGPKAIIGISCYNQLEPAIQAEQEGADYVAFGSFFASSIKPEAVKATPDLLETARSQLQIPIVAIGGITPGNAQTLIDAGADMLAVISAVFAQDDIRKAAQKFSNLFQD